MKDLQIFNNPEFGEIRMLVVDGKAYAVGVDVAKALEYADASRAVRDHCKGGVTYPVLTNGGMQNAKIIPEGDIMRLIVKAADQSKNQEIKAKAERFEKLVFDEILPSVAKNGMYMTEKTSNDLLNDPTAFLAKAVLIAQEQIAKKEAELAAANERLEIAEPKAEAWTIVAEDEGFLLTAGEMAKTAALPGLKESNVRDILRDKNILCKDKNELTADAMRKGFGRMIVDTIDTGYRVIPIKTPKFRGKTLDMVVRCWKQKAGSLF